MKILAQLQTLDGQHVGPSLNLPTDITKQNLEVLLSQFQEEKGNFAFFVRDKEITDNLQGVLDSVQHNAEDILRISFIPQASFKVSAVTRCSSTLSGHTESILQVLFSPDGRRAASCSGDCSVRIWDLTTETPQHTLEGHTNWVLCISWSPDGRYLASGSMDNAVIIWDTKSGQMLGQPLRSHTKYITALSWEPYHLNIKCNRLVSSSKDCSAKVWNVVTRQLQFTVTSHTDAVTCVRWSGEGLIYTGSRDKSIRVWDGSNGKLCRILLGHAHWINTMALSTGYVLRQGPYDKNGSLLTIDAVLDRYNKSLPERCVTGSDDFTIFLWAPSKDKKSIARMTGHQQLVNQVVFTPDGRMIASGSFDKSIKLWSGLTGEFITSLRSHVSPVYQVCFSSDSRYLLSGSKDSTLKLWDLKTKKLKADLPGHADEVFTVDWSPGTDGRVMSGGRDRLIKFWRN